MLILSYFDRRAGPMIYLTAPADLDRKPYENIKSLLDRDEQGFFTHSFSPDIKTANYIFSLDSEWARGRSEGVMISAICYEEEPDYERYERILSRFTDKLKLIPDMYKAFYNHVKMKEIDEDVGIHYLILKEELKNIDKILSLKKIETHGQVLSYSEINKKEKISIPSDISKQLGILAKKNYFLVYRTRNQAMKVDMIPIDADEVFGLKIIFREAMNLPIIQNITQIISKHENKGLSLIFTTGICQEGSRCIYELYVDTSKFILEQIMEDLAEIEGILQIDMQLIKEE